MLNDNSTPKYPYTGVPLMPEAIQELILELFPGQTLKRNSIVMKVRETHLTRGGLDSEAADFPRSVKKALENLKAYGFAENPAHGMWRISGEAPPEPEVMTEHETVDKSNNTEITPDADIILGTGRSAVYVYYFDTYRQKAIQDGTGFWPCKIGRTDRDPLNRVLTQASTALPEFPHIAIIFYTENPSEWEHALHAILKLRGKTTTDSPGTEWFNTSPEEIIEVIRYIDPSQINDNASG